MRHLDIVLSFLIKKILQNLLKMGFFPTALMSNNEAQ